MVARGSLRIVAAALIGWLLPLSAQAQGTIIPFVSQAFYDSNGNPLSSGKLCSYAAGTTTPLSTYSDVTLTTPNANPVILTSSGRPSTGAIFLSPTAYKFILLSAGSDATCSTGTTQWTLDNVTAIPPTNVNLDVTGTAGETIAAGQVVYLSDGSGGKNAGQWYLADADFTYASNTALFVGMATAAVTSGASGSFRIQGRMTALSGLVAGSRYYVSATAGSTTSTAPTNSRFVGAADSTTTMVIAPDPAQLFFATYAVGDLLYADTTTTLNKLADVATGRVLASGGVNTAPAWSAAPTLSGGLTSGGDIVMSADNKLRRSTSDGTDNGLLYLAGGGDVGVARGGYFALHGNEASSGGSLEAILGNVSGATFSVALGGGSSAFSIAGNDGSVSSTVNLAGIAWQLSNSNASPIGLDVNYTGAAPNGTGNIFVRGRDTGATRFELRSNGGLANFSANNVNLSDARAKDILGPAPSQRALFRRLQFVQARYKATPYAPLDIMVTAQQVRGIYPNLVTPFADGYLGVREEPLMMRGLKVIQEMDAQLLDQQDRLEKQLDLISGIDTRLRALEADNTALRARLATAEQRSH